MRAADLVEGNWYWVRTKIKGSKPYYSDAKFLGMDSPFRARMAEEFQSLDFGTNRLRTVRRLHSVRLSQIVPPGTE